MLLRIANVYQCLDISTWYTNGQFGGQRWQINQMNPVSAATVKSRAAVHFLGVPLYGAACGVSAWFTFIAMLICSMKQVIFVTWALLKGLFYRLFILKS